MWKLRPARLGLFCKEAAHVMPCAERHAHGPPCFALCPLFPPAPALAHRPPSRWHADRGAIITPSFCHPSCSGPPLRRTHLPAPDMLIARQSSRQALRPRRRLDGCHALEIWWVNCFLRSPCTHQSGSEDADADRTFLSSFVIILDGKSPHDRTGRDHQRHLPMNT